MLSVRIAIAQGQIPPHRNCWRVSAEKFPRRVGVRAEKLGMQNMKRSLPLPTSYERRGRRRSA